MRFLSAFLCDFFLFEYRSYESGEIELARYQRLVNTSGVPFVCASGIGRVIDSTGNWTVGAC